MRTTQMTMPAARTDENTVDRPSLFWLFTEWGRALTELGFYIPYRKFLASKNHGDQHPVMVLPGFMALPLLNPYENFSLNPAMKHMDGI
ncbi:MAG: hypothetical protein AAFR66_12970 [Bacteroidota bacterium]